MKEYLEDARKVMEDQGTRDEGLSAPEAAARLEQFGRNRLEEGERVSLAQRFLKELADPMIIILIIAAAVSGVTAAISGESFADVVIILAVVIINAVLGVVQENKAEKAIEALREISAATSKVVRGGHQLTIRSEELVPGDVIVLEAGDAVPADARLIEAASLKVEEAALTGESVPVSKVIEALGAEGGKDVPLGDRRNMVYSGSTVVYGRGRAVVTQTGMRTEMGKIAEALANAKDDETPLQRRLNQLSKVLSFLVLGICAFIFLLGVFRQYPNITLHSMLDTFMVAVSLAVAAIPEGLAAVVTVVLSIGVTNMSRRSAVIRRLTAVETLGCTQVICSDKTGTLTQNRMTVVEHTGYDEPLLATAMALCSDAELEGDAATGEPTECALVNYAHGLGLDKPALKAAQPRVGEAPFDSLRKMMSTVHKKGDGYIQYTKGAPDEVLRRCTHALVHGQILPMTSKYLHQILSDNQFMAGRALRVLCAAMRTYDALPESFDADQLERGLCFIGLTGMIDPIRPEVADAIAECRSAGVRPVMITGDHRDTAAAIAMQLGIIDNAGQAMTGAQLDDLSDEELDDRVENCFVYARVQPEHKVRIVNAWKKKGKVTAMTGDGVNDAPSIKNADIGIGMGITGTDVTKNVADMVLADDNFATIVSAVEEGRRIYANIRKAIQLLLSTNLSEVMSIFAATLMGFTLLQPAHLLWVNLITDCFPALALGLEKAEKDSMRRPPRDSSEGIFGGGLGLDIVIQSLLVTIITLAAFFIGRFAETGAWGPGGSATGTTLAFLALSLTETFHSFNLRSLRGSLFGVETQNWFLWGAAVLSIALTLAVLYVPFLRAAFGFAYIAPALFVRVLGLSFSIIPIVECIKLVERKLGR